MKEIEKETYTVSAPLVLGLLGLLGGLLLMRRKRGR